MTLAALQSLIALGESETLEFKRSTAELRRAGETLCTFLNGKGGNVLTGVGSDGSLVDHVVADMTCPAPPQVDPELQYAGPVYNVVR